MHLQISMNYLWSINIHIQAILVESPPPGMCDPERVAFSLDTGGAECVRNEYTIIWLGIYGHLELTQY